MSEIKREARVGEFEVIDHGVEHAQYFQGCGCSYTRFDNVTTGCGNSAAEAFDDALDSIAQGGVDVGAIEASEDGKLFTSEKAQSATVEAAHPGSNECEDCELYYYVSVRWNEAKGGAK